MCQELFVTQLLIILLFLSLIVSAFKLSNNSWTSTSCINSAACIELVGKEVHYDSMAMATVKLIVRTAIQTFVFIRGFASNLKKYRFILAKHV